MQYIRVRRDQSSFYHAPKTRLLSSWLHFATAYHPTGETRKLSFRLASTDDLGRENTGSDFHLRVGPTEGGLEKRVLSGASYGVILDYIYSENGDTLWDNIHKAPYSTLGSEAANWFENNQAIAGCWVFGGRTSAGALDTGDNGVAAFGWNGQEFKFNGRSGDWLSDCTVD